MDYSTIDYNSPLYIQLREVLRSKIESGEYPPGTRIPSENQLAQTYGIHRLSARSAVSALVYEGYLVRRQGKGVYVLPQKVERDLDTIGGFTQTMKERHREPSKRILVKGVRKAGPYIGKILDVEPESQVCYIRRICSSDGVPVSLEDIYIPCSRVPNLDSYDLEVFSIYDIYKMAGINLMRVEQTLDIITLDAVDANFLDIDTDSAVLLFCGITYDTEGVPVEYAKTFTRTDTCTFVANYNKNN